MPKHKKSRPTDFMAKFHLASYQHCNKALFVCTAKAQILILWTDKNNSILRRCFTFYLLWTLNISIWFFR